MRLTNANREVILNNAINHAFEKDAKALEKRGFALAKKCYEAAIPARERKAIADLPKRWFNWRKETTFNVCGERHKLSFQDSAPMPSDGDGYSVAIPGINDAALLKEIHALIDDREAHRKKKDTAERTLSVLLQTYSTLDGLRNAWPEGQPFFRHLEGQIKAVGLPVVRVSELNAMLAL